MNWYLVALRKYATFHGRARRAEFWMFTLVDAAIAAILLGAALAVALNTGGGPHPLVVAFGIGNLVYALATLLPSLGVRVRRLHDTGRSGWYLCWSLLPIVGPIIVLAALCAEGIRGPNAYGSDPKPALWPGHPVDPAAYPFGPPPTMPPPYGSFPYGQPLGPPVSAPAGLPSPATPPVAKRKSASIVGGVTIGTLLLLVCAGVVRGFVTQVSETKAAAGPSTPARPGSLGGGNPSADAGQADDEELDSQAPQASTYPAETIGDLDRVCNDNVFYPQSPKRAGKAPHPVVLLVEEGDGSDIRLRNGSYFFFGEGLSERDRAIWASEDPGTVQLVACLDRVSTGKKIRSCKYDEPTPETVALMRADWRLRVYEAATGRKIHDKAMPGDDRKCPSSVRVGPDRRIYAQASDRSILVALRKYVKK